MRKVYLFLLGCLFVNDIVAQMVTLNPTVSPSGFKSTDQITVTYNVSGTLLASLTDAYIWVWIPGKNIDAKYNLTPANDNTPLVNNAKFTKNENGGTTTFSITFVPQDFFVQPICLETQLGMLIKGNDWSNGQTTDYIAPMTPLSSCFVVELTSPTDDPLFISPGSNLIVEAQSSEAATFTLSVDGVQVNQQASITDYSYSYAVPQSSGIYPVTLLVENAENDTTMSFQYLIDTPSDEMARPDGVIPGINYSPSDATTVTLCLNAPLKNAAYLLGEFNDFELSLDFKMYKDGDYFWITLDDLTPGQEYAYQYLVDGMFVADPYAEKILDPEDIYVDESTYPDLKPYPQTALRSTWYFNRVSVFQTGQTPYEWQVTSFEKPAIEELVIYEVLLRDFFDDGNRNYQSLIDTLTYLKRLGINAIELMPVMEFNGNESWGYNPTFMFAPDKYYGTKNKLKELVDKCHQNGIAVILDIALNHQDIPNSYAIMYFNFDIWKPTAESPYFNVDARHPFNVFNDMNHESIYTQAYVDTINYYWLNEFKVDGFRFDLSKGFTQVNSGSNVSQWGNYDASRVALLKRMSDKIWSHTPDAYVILEHFGANSEEKELAEYRAGEGKGMMLWGKMTDPFNQNTMGYASNPSSDVSGTFHGNRGWSVPHLIGYMESHDEERLMYKNLEFGNSFGDYDAKRLSTALLRMKAGFALFLAIPGPKMIWEFGELGFDHGINRCENGDYNPPGSEGGDGDCRLSIKPPVWEYAEDIHRVSLYNFVSDFIRLRKTYDVFNTSSVTLGGMTTLTKTVVLKNEPYTASPATADEMNAVLVTNFDVSQKTIQVSFPHNGTWYNYYDGTELNVTSTPFDVTLSAGRLALYTDVQIDNQLLVTDVETGETESLSASVYPNPARDYLKVTLPAEITDVEFFSIQGKPVSPERTGADQWNVSMLAPGMYVIDLRSVNRKRYQLKFIKI